MTSKDLIKLLQKNGWEKVSTSGSHMKFKKNGETIIVPYHTKDLPKGTLNKILKDTGLK